MLVVISTLWVITFEGFTYKLKTLLASNAGASIQMPLHPSFASVFVQVSWLELQWSLDTTEASSSAPKSLQVVSSFEQQS